jgi:hypothetical protein
MGDGSERSERSQAVLDSFVQPVALQTAFE